MKRAVLCIAASLAVGSPAFAAGMAPKHAVPAPVKAQCETPVSEFLHAIADGKNGLLVSPSLNPKQYSFVKDTVKKHSADHKELPGNSATVVGIDGEFALLLTMSSGDDTKVCAVVPVPAELVASIVALGEPSKDETPKTPKTDPDEMSL